MRNQQSGNKSAAHLAEADQSHRAQPHQQPIDKHPVVPHDSQVEDDSAIGNSKNITAHNDSQVENDSAVPNNSQPHCAPPQGSERAKLATQLYPETTKEVVEHAKQVPLASLAEYEDNACFFRAFSSSIRIAIVHYLSYEPRTVTEIATHFDLSQPHVSQHLKVLREARVLKTTKQGRNTVYDILDSHVCIMLGMALAHQHEQPHLHDHKR